MAVLRLRKRNARAVACSHEAAALKKLESEAQFVNQQAQIEWNAAQIAAMEKLESETEFEEQKAGAEAKLLGVSFAGLQEELEELGVEAVEDLRELEAEDVERLAGKLKKVQAKKFAKKIAALQA